MASDQEMLLPGLHAQLKPARDAIGAFRPAVAEAASYLWKTTRPIELRVTRHR